MCMSRLNTCTPADQGLVVLEQSSVDVGFAAKVIQHLSHVRRDRAPALTSSRTGADDHRAALDGTDWHPSSSWEIDRLGRTNGYYFGCFVAIRWFCRQGSTQGRGLVRYRIRAVADRRGDALAATRRTLVRPRSPPVVFSVRWASRRAISLSVSSTVFLSAGNDESSIALIQIRSGRLAVPNATQVGSQGDALK
jgi:hypothetical protein